MKVIFVILVCLTTAFCFHHTNEHQKEVNFYFPYGYNMLFVNFFNCPDLFRKQEKLFDMAIDSNGHLIGVSHEHSSTVSFAPGKVFESLTLLESKTNSEPIYYTDNDDKELRKLVEDGKILINNATSLIHAQKGYVYHEWVNTFFTVNLNSKNYSNILNANFSRVINELPSDFAGNEKKYFDFIKKYGTHFLKKAYFGSMIRRHQLVDSSDFNTYIYRYERNMPEFFNVPSNFKVTCRNQDNPRKSLRLRDEDNSKMEVFGGDAPEYQKLGFVNWNKTVIDSPALLKVEFEPIYKLVTNSKVANNIRVAVSIYVRKVYLENCDWYLKIAKGCHSPSNETLVLQSKFITAQSLYNATALTELANAMRVEAQHYLKLENQGNC